MKYDTDYKRKHKNYLTKGAFGRVDLDLQGLERPKKKKVTK